MGCCVRGVASSGLPWCRASRAWHSSDLLAHRIHLAHALCAFRLRLLRADADVVCIKPIDAWDANANNRAIIGLEAAVSEHERRRYMLARTIQVRVGLRNVRFCPLVHCLLSLLRIAIYASSAVRVRDCSGAADPDCVFLASRACLLVAAARLLPIVTLLRAALQFCQWTMASSPGHPVFKIGERSPRCCFRSVFGASLVVPALLPCSLLCVLWLVSCPPLVACSSQSRLPSERGSERIELNDFVLFVPLCAAQLWT